MKDDLLRQALLEIEDYYRSQGMAGEVGFGSFPAVLVIDFQRGITDPTRPAGCNLDKEIEATAVLLNKARQKEVPVIFTVIGYHHTLIDGGLLLKKLPALGDNIAGSRNLKIDSRLDPRPDEPVIIKPYPSAFFATSLASSLKALSVDTLIVTGCITSGCVRATVTDSMQHGFRTIVPRECVGDRARIPHEVNLMDMAARFADVLSLEVVLDYLGTLR